MKRTVWYMFKPGEERDYAMTRPPSPDWAVKMDQEGFILVSFEIELPDPAHIQLGTQVVLGPYRRSMGPHSPMVAHTVGKLTDTLRKTFYRAGGDCLCMDCGEDYRHHPMDEVEKHLTVLCDGRRVKL